MTPPESQTTFSLKAAGGFVAVAMVLVVLVSCTTSSQAESTPATPTAAASTPTMSNQVVPAPPARDRGTGGSLFIVEDGYIADGESLSPFDINYPAVGNLNPDLLAAVQSAASDAVRDDVEIRINSGWRSARYQQGLLDDAIVTYGSVDEARKWVNTPEQSTHVTGNAVDIGPTDADSWLSQYGYEYGLCQTYANEIWHFELATAPGGACPPQISDALAGS